MKMIETALPEVRIFEPRVFGDERGFFMETWNARVFAELGLDEIFVQDNYSRSSKGVLRGLHYQIRQPQGKLIQVTVGAAYDVAVDLRRSSPTFGQWVGVRLSAENKRILWVPPGFGHGFLSLEDGTDFLYRCTDYYAPEYERSLSWKDPEIAIDWPLNGVVYPTLSEKDADAPTLADAEVYP